MVAYMIVHLNISCTKKRRLARVYSAMYLGVHLIFHSALITFEITGESDIIIYTRDPQGVNGFWREKVTQMCTRLLITLNKK